MIPLLALHLAAHAESTWWDPDGVSNCQNNSAIVGTAGYRNAAAAITTNATTYGAAQWAERHLLPVLHRADRPEGWTGGGAMDTNLVFGATRVPTLELGYPYGDCPEDYRISMRPLDLGASNFGFVARKGRFGLFYAGSLTWSGSAFANNAARGMLTGSYYIWGGVGAMAAPALGGWSYTEGVGTVAPDWILGGAADLSVLWVDAGYVGSRGVYANVQEGRVGFFGSALLQKAVAGLPFFKAGAQGVESPAGLSSVYARRLPIQALPRYDAESGRASSTAGDEVEERLETAHLEQLNIGRIVDVYLAGAWKPSPQLWEARLGLHSKDYHQGRKASDAGTPGQTQAGFLVQAGVVQLPDMYYYGVEGGLRGTGRLEYTFGVPVDGGTSLYGQMRLLWNDPEVLALYPYAVGGTWFSYRLWTTF